MDGENIILFWGYGMKRNVALWLCLAVAVAWPAKCLSWDLPAVVSDYIAGRASGCSLSCAEPGIWAGYSESRRGFRVSTTHESIDGAAALSQEFVANIKGTWVGGVLPLASGCSASLTIAGACLVPSGFALDQEEGSANPDFSGPQRWFNTKVNSYFLETQGIYRLSEACGLVGGFRWDVVSLRLSHPDVQTFTYQDSPGWEGDITVTSYEPYVGLEVVRGSELTGRLRMQLVGFPALFGNVRFGDSFPNSSAPPRGVARYQSKARSFKKGYFGEMLADYSWGVSSSSRIGLLGRLAFFHGISNGSTERLANDPFQPDAPIGSVPADVDYDRCIAIVGGTFRYGFQYAFLTRWLQLER